MKKSLYFGASMLAVAAAAIVPASAADMYRAEPGGYKDAPVYVPANTWTGFYVGAHLGGAAGSEKVTDIDGWENVLNSSFSNDSSGLLGGVQAGYNWQHGNIVLGVEADLGGMDISHTTLDPISHGSTSARQAGGLYGDVTGRLGYAFGPALLYAKGGFAFFDGEARMDCCGDPKTAAGSKSTGAFTGWTLGGGLEYALTPAWSVKAEYQHFDFGKEDSVICVECNPGFRFGHDLTVETVKAGLNYHVGKGYESLK